MSEMMKYENDNGDVFEGTTPTEVVRSMSRAKLTKSKNLGRYRRATARRIKEMMGLTIDASSDNLFLKSLVEADLLKPID